MHNISLFLFIIVLSICTNAKISLLNIQECKIDKEGTFKYIQIYIKNIKNPLDNLIIIRGSVKHSTHADIYYSFINEIENKYSHSLYNTYSFRPIGGGYIKITSNTIYIYGTSGTYGQCNHVLTSEKIRNYFNGKYYIFNFTNLDSYYNNNNYYYEE